MSFKMPVKQTKLGILKLNAYVKMLAILLTKKHKDGVTAPFIIVLNHKYANLNEDKSKKLPLFLLGNRDSSWKDFHKTKLDDGSTQKQFTVSGSCTRQGDTLNLTIDGSKGLTKVPNKIKQLLGAILKRIDKKLVLTVGGGAVAAASDATATVATAATANKEEKTAKPKKAAAPEVKKATKEEAIKLSDAVKKIKQLLKKTVKRVKRNIEKGSISGKDIQSVKEANKAYDDFCKLHDEVSAPVQKKFKAAHKKIVAKRKDLIKLSLIVKQNKKSLAQRLADNYFKEKMDRVASEKETKAFNDILKDTIKYNKKSKYADVGQNKLFRATSFVLKKVGVKKYKAEFTDRVLEKIA